VTQAAPQLAAGLAIAFAGLGYARESGAALVRPRAFA